MQRKSFLLSEIFSYSSLNKELFWLIFGERKFFALMYCFEKQVERTHEQSARDGISQTGLDVFLVILRALSCTRSRQRCWTKNKTIHPFPVLMSQSKEGLSRIADVQKATTFSLFSNLALIVSGWSKPLFVTFKAHIRACGKVTFPKWCVA